MNDDAQLIRQVLAGQGASFGLLVQKYQDRLYNTLVHVIGNAEDAKDVTQEAFVQAMLKLETFQGGSAFYTWLYRIAFNAAISFRRKRGAMRRAEEGRWDQDGRAREGALRDGRVENKRAYAGGDSPSDRIEREERCAQVRRAMDTLAEEHRVVLVLREIDGCCYETIAEVLDLPVGTVRSRLHRARMQLRDQLKEVTSPDD